MANEMADELLLRIGEKLRQLRREKGYNSHEDFAQAHDLARVQYWRLEKGKSNFTMKSLDKVVAIHGLTVVEFLGKLDG